MNLRFNKVIFGAVAVVVFAAVAGVRIFLPPNPRMNADGSTFHGFPAPGVNVESAECSEAKKAFSLFDGGIKINCDESFLYVAADTGLPLTVPGQAEPKLMVGIKNFIMRVPVPFAFNWKLPLKPKMLDTPVEAASRGPIGIAIDGVPIFLWDKRPDSSDPPGYYDPKYDTIVQDEVDHCGGHAGQGEDYHYHYAPVCLVDVKHLDRPIGYGIDGVPIYYGTGGTDFFGDGKLNAINNVPGKLDACNGFTKPDGGYAYYTTKEHPYTLGCHFAVANTELQINVPPFRNQGVAQPGGGVAGEASKTLITDFYLDDKGWRHLEYAALSGNGTSAILYKATEKGQDCWDFEYRVEKVTQGVHESYCRGQR
jgi:YHYH protein